MLRQLQSGGLIGRDGDDRDRLTLTEEGRRVLRGEAPFALREDVVNPKARRRRVAEAVAAGGRGRGASRRAQGPARRDRDGAEAAGLCHFPRSDADRNRQAAAPQPRRTGRRSWRRRGQAGKIRERFSRGDAGAWRRLSGRNARLGEGLHPLNHYPRSFSLSLSRIKAWYRLRNISPSLPVRRRLVVENKPCRGISTIRI